ncbi:hypothetical protein BDY19DRAFT_976606 [Irpex rosettiformis]|uniref:Uncharacterized protein n=1 Tax=Irpex rosettiformis TaxID=378272 RepID=A0ACB8TNU7_9APHY|nr:hypothetical protein BDY19DRAFT_976606 [Irpex rosettiformis]
MQDKYGTRIRLVFLFPSLVLTVVQSHLKNGNVVISGFRTSSVSDRLEEPIYTQILHDIGSNAVPLRLFLNFTLRNQKHMEA